MNINWFELLLVIAGGIIGVAGSLMVALVGNGLANKKARRDDLLAAYVEWSRVLQHSIYAGEKLMIYEALDRKEKGHPEKRKSVPSGLYGETHEDHARELMDAEDALYAAKARLLLLDARPAVRKRINNLSELRVLLGSPTPEEVIKFSDFKRARIEEFIEDIAGKRSGF